MLIYVFAALALGMIIGPFAWHWRWTSKIMNERKNHDVQMAVSREGNSETGLQDLMTKYPTYPLPAVRWAERKFDEQDWDEALRRCKVIASKFPGEAMAHVIPMKILCKKGKLEDANIMGIAVLKMFPLSREALIQSAYIASGLCDWPEAVQRWARVREYADNWPQGYVSGAAALAEVGRIEEADAVMRTGIDLVGPIFLKDLVIPYADVAHRRGNWIEAAERWKLVRSRLEQYPVGYWRGSEALRQIGRSEEAISIVENALIMFPKNEDVRREAAALQIEVPVA